MVLENVTKQELLKYFKTRYDFEESTKTSRGGLNDFKKRLSKVMQIKPKDVNEAYKMWKQKCEGEDIEDNSAIVLEIVEAVLVP